MSAKFGEFFNLSLADSASISPGCCLPRCMRQPASAGPCLLHVLSAAHGFLRGRTSEPCHTETRPCRARVRHRPHSQETQYIKTVRERQDPQCFNWWNFENFQNFKKFKNAGNCPRSAQNQKKLKNFTFKFFSKFSINFSFVRFSDNF
jgi:hypothetical protein